MSSELVLRQKAIRLKQAGRIVSWICQHLERSREWFYKWWRRYLLEGASGLRDRSHAPKTNPRGWSSEIRQAILDIRDQLARRRGPRKRYRLAGAPTIRHELACLGYEPLPSLRTIVRSLAVGRSNVARISAAALHQLEHVSTGACHAQQPASSSRFDRTALLERLAAAVVFPGVSGRLRRGSFRRISAQTTAGNGPGICGAGLAETGSSRCLAGRQQRCLWPDLAPWLAQSFCPIGAAGGHRFDVYPRTRAMAKRSHRTFQRLVPRALVGYSSSFAISSASQAGRDDGHLFSRTYPSQFEFPNYRSGSPKLIAAHVASQLLQTPTTFARADWPRDFYPAHTSVWTHYHPGSKIQSRKTAGPSICLCDPLHAHYGTQDPFWRSPDQAIRLPVRRQANTVSDHVTLIFLQLSSALTWRLALIAKYLNLTHLK